MANLLEAYKDRLAISEKVYAKAHNGDSMSKAKKLATAKCLENINKFMNEAFDNTVPIEEQPTTTESTLTVDSDEDDFFETTI